MAGVYTYQSESVLWLYCNVYSNIILGGNFNFYNVLVEDQLKFCNGVNLYGKRV
jgi:hypothetical protein